MLVGTFTIVSDTLYPLNDPRPPPKGNKYPRPFVPEAVGPAIPGDFELLPKGPPLPNVDDGVIGNDVIADDVIRKEGVAVPVYDGGGGVKTEGVKEGGDGGRREGEEVQRRGGEGEVQDEHDSIKKDMDELRERIKAVEEENQELKVLRLGMGHTVHNKPGYLPIFHKYRRTGFDCEYLLNA